MDSSLSQLELLASRPICALASDAAPLAAWGSIGGELANLLAARNGFYVYESALLVRPLCNTSKPLGIFEWNAISLWKAEYSSELADALFFAEDVFGGQFGVFRGQIITLDPETGEFSPLCSTLSEWAREVIDNHDFRTGHTLAHAWQSQNGPLPTGMRLVPKTPFVCGGAYDLENLCALEDVNGMLFRASLARQIRDVPDGAPIVFKLE